MQPLLSASMQAKNAHIDRFEIQNEVGKGGTAVVFCAKDKKLGGTVAIKKLRHCVDFFLQEELLDEAKTTKELAHPHIPTVMDSGVWKDGRAFFVMNLIHGSSLDINSKELTDQ